MTPDEIQRGREAIKSVVQAAGGALDVRTILERYMRITNTTGDPDEMARQAGFNPEDVLELRPEIHPAIRMVKT